MCLGGQGHNPGDWEAVRRKIGPPNCPADLLGFLRRIGGVVAGCITGMCRRHNGNASEIDERYAVREKNLGMDGHKIYTQTLSGRISPPSSSFFSSSVDVGRKRAFQGAPHSALREGMQQGQGHGNGKGQTLHAPLWQTRDGQACRQRDGLMVWGDGGTLRRQVPATSSRNSIQWESM